MTRRAAPAKLNLSLVVGPLRPDGKHELATVFQRIDLADRVELGPAPALEVEGFPGDTLVRRALESIVHEAGVEPRWRARITKHIPVAAGLGGGSSDAATALLLANRTLERPLDRAALHRLAAGLGADVPFFLEPGPQLGQGDGRELTPLALPQDYHVVLVLPQGAEKPSTASVYTAFDERGGAQGFEERRQALLDLLADISSSRDLAGLPRNDLASSPLETELLARGAFRAGVSGAGPTVYGLFAEEAPARAAKHSFEARGRTWLTVPTWYG